MTNLLEANGVETALSPGYFEDAEDDFRRAVQEVHEAMAREAATKQHLANARRDVETAEARWWRDGHVTGGNAEQRQAALAILRDTDPDYLRVAGSVRLFEASLAEVQRDLERARELRSLAKRRMEHATATLLYYANPENADR